MRVFISHAGERSKAVAQELQRFVRKLVPSADPWISTGIDKGSRWAPEIADSLEAAGVGIVCVTSDNLRMPWLLFEAGALSKRLDGKVCTFLLDIDASAVEAPLGQFQHTTAEKADVLALMESINKRVEATGEPPRNVEDLREQFDTLWPKLQEVVSRLRKQVSARPVARTSDDMLKEVLELVRGIVRENDRHNGAVLLDLDRDGLRDGIGALDDLPALAAITPFASVGDVVQHPQFGKGQVISTHPIENQPDDMKLIVRFKTVGQKALRWKFARLTVLR